MARRKSKKKRSRGLRRLALVLLVIGLGCFAWLAWPLWQFAERFAERPLTQPSRLYGQAPTLVVGSSVDVMGLKGELDALGYRKVGGRPSWGEYASSAAGLSVYLRSYLATWGLNSGGPLDIRWSGRRVTDLNWRGQSVEKISLEPPLLFSFYGPDRQERRPVALSQLPRELIQAVLAAEDARFFQHKGLSLRGIARAAWANLTGGGIRQGGSTLTQQLVKNLFLTQERTYARKLREIVLAVFIDWRYDKEEILGAYLNEIYWGSSAGANLMGVGAAAWAYFGKEPAHLDLCESAVLAGMISSPGGYSPVGKPERSRSRRDWVLGRLSEVGWLEPAAVEKEMARPLCVSPQPVTVRRAPYFGDRMAAEAARRFGVDGLADAGYVLMSTLSRADQEAAEAAVQWGLEALEKGWEKQSNASGPLQAALVSINPQSGAIRAYVGGRDYGKSQFDRASLAQRQAGSAFKPVVYAAAFESGHAAPSTLIEDAPLTVALAGRSWSPQNSNSEFRGWVSVRTALEDSLNVPTARLAIDVGLDDVVATARGMGISSRLQPVPALSLGAFELTPLELASVYAVLANGGVRTEIHGLRAVLDPQAEPVQGDSLSQPSRVLSPQATYLLTSVLQGVLDRGTGSSARVQGLRDPLAGKTGTTNDRRDSWFGGYSPDRVSLVWVGYDDNSPTHLSGARAALPIWARYTYKVRPAGGYPVFSQPDGVTSAVIDPLSGQLATDDCDQVLTEVFLDGRAPTEICRLHGSWQIDGEPPAGSIAEPRKKERFRWFKKLFKKDQSKAESPG